MVEIDQRTIIRASEWYLRMSDERERTKSEEPPRPRFRRRTWGTLRVGLSCESAKVTSYDQNELEGPGICHPGYPSNIRIGVPGLRILVNRSKVCRVGA